MALINDSRLFTGGNERIDLRPHVQLYAQLKQKEQARNDAFDEYIRGINMRINPSGMRHNERPVFEDKLKKWQDFAMQNREALRNPRKDGGQASINFQAGFQELQNLIARSKGVEEFKKPGVEVVTDPNKMKKANKDKIMAGFQANDQDLYMQDPKTGEWVDNPNWRPFSPTDIEYKNDPFDLGKFKGLFKDIKRQELAPEVGATDPKTMMRTVTKRSLFDQPAKDQIAEIGVTQYMADDSFKELVDQLDPKQYNDFFKANFGRDIDPAHEKADLAAAYALKQNQEEVVTTDAKEDALARDKIMEGIRNANRRGLLKYKSQLDESDEAANDLWYDSYIDEVTADAKKNPSKVYPGAGLGWEIPLDPFLKKNLSDKQSDPDKLIVTVDGRYVPVFYQRDDSGNIIYTKSKSKSGGDEIETFPVTNTSRTATMQRDQLKVSLGGKSGVKQLNREMSADKKGSPANKSQKTKTVEIIRGELD